MHKLHELKEKLVKELENYSEKQRITREDVETIKYLASAIDHICNVVDGGSGMSFRNSYESSNNGSYDSYSRDYSRRRDSMGRYSRAEDDFRSELQKLMKDAPTEQMRQRMQNLMNEL